MTPRVALVTGGARGIGRAIALDLARRGWQVAVGYRTSAGAAAETRAAIEAAGGRLRADRRPRPCRGALPAGRALRGDAGSVAGHLRREPPLALRSGARGGAGDAGTAVGAHRRLRAGRSGAPGRAAGGPRLPRR